MNAELLRQQGYALGLGARDVTQGRHDLVHVGPAGQSGTSVVIDHDIVDPELLPDEAAIAAVTLAELAAGPHATDDAEERSRRTDRLQWAATTWDALPFDADAARAYGRVYAAMRTAGRTTKSSFADLLIAATAVSNGVPVYTRNPSDLEQLKSIVEIITV